MRFFISWAVVLIFFSCTSHNDNPDVSNIKVSLKTKRFEKDLFSIDSINMASQIDSIIALYPDFGENFIYTILNADPKWNPDTTANYLNGFVNAYKSLYDSAENIYKDFYLSEICVPYIIM